MPLVLCRALLPSTLGVLSAPESSIPADHSKDSPETRAELEGSLGLDEGPGYLLPGTMAHPADPPLGSQNSLDSLF